MWQDKQTILEPRLLSLEGSHRPDSTMGLGLGSRAMIGGQHRTPEVTSPYSTIFPQASLGLRRSEMNVFTSPGDTSHKAVCVSLVHRAVWFLSGIWSLGLTLVCLQVPHTVLKKSRNTLSFECMGPPPTHAIENQSEPKTASWDPKPQWISFCPPNPRRMISKSSFSCLNMVVTLDHQRRCSE